VLGQRQQTALGYLPTVARIGTKYFCWRKRVTIEKVEGVRRQWQHHWHYRIILIDNRHGWLALLYQMGIARYLGRASLLGARMTPSGDKRLSKNPENIRRNQTDNAIMLSLHHYIILYHIQRGLSTLILSGGVSQNLGEFALAG
jgi:hypothetical protein